VCKGGNLVVDAPERKVFGVIMFPEPFESDISIVIGVLPFPFVDRD
jgi:hypothetical protein